MHRVILLLLCWPLLTGALGASYDFETSDGNDDIDFGGSVLGNNNTTYTITGWFNHDAGDTSTNEQTLYGEGNNADNTPIQTSAYQSNVGGAGEAKCFSRTNSQTAQSVCSGCGLNDGVWHHLACVSNGNSSLKLYIDGVEKAEDTTTRSDTMNLNTARIGALERTSVINRADDARISHVAIWSSVALGEGDLTSLASGMNPTCVSQKPDRYWPLWDDGTVEDLSGNNDVGTVTGATLFTDGPPVMMSCGGAA